MFRLLNLLFSKWKMYQLQAKIKAKDIFFNFEVCDYLYQISADLQEPTNK